MVIVMITVIMTVMIKAMMTVRVMATVMVGTLLMIKISNHLKKSRIRETRNLSTDADSSTNIFASAGVKKGTDIIFFYLYYI